MLNNLVPRACDPWEGNEGSGIIRCRKPGILAKIELRIHFNGQSDSSLKRIIPEPSFPSQVSQARGTRLGVESHVTARCQGLFQPRPQGLLRTWRVKNEKTLVKAAKISTIHGHFSACAKANLPWR